MGISYYPETYTVGILIHVFIKKILNLQFMLPLIINTNPRFLAQKRMLLSSNITENNLISLSTPSLCKSVSLLA